MSRKLTTSTILDAARRNVGGHSLKYHGLNSFFGLSQETNEKIKATLSGTGILKPEGSIKRDTIYLEKLDSKSPTGLTTVAVKVPPPVVTAPSVPTPPNIQGVTPESPAPVNLGNGINASGIMQAPAYSTGAPNVAASFFEKNKIIIFSAVGGLVLLIILFLVFKRK